MCDGYFYVERDKNGHPSANQGLSTAEPIQGLALGSPPPVPPFLLTQNLSPKDIASMIEAKRLVMSYEVIGQERVKLS